ncbi:hypothetical protein N9Y89_01325 [bacterium]|nr:hypothetical protein [bacterium]
MVDFKQKKNMNFDVIVIGSGPWVNDIHNEEKSLYEIQESFESYWEGKAIGKGKG